MSDIVVSVRGLSKRYALGPIRSPLSLPRWLRRRGRRHEQDEIWALRDISFEVARGERIGIIGRNGAGKSTLLKILSRVVYPTEGEARIRGRVTSLLEVGTGFNDALSGRENIYLNASLHGLSRREIDERLDDIIDFSEVRRFIDSPVKHYSSGMRMRLAFSVAAHLDPDILMLDEVLAVGDAAFQRKSLGRMDELTSSGRTVLFVSHSMDSVSRFCDRCLWLDGGRLIADGPTEEVVAAYLTKVFGLTPQIAAGHEEIETTRRASESAPAAIKPTLNESDSPAEFVSAQITGENGPGFTAFRVNECITISFQYRVWKPGRYVPSISLTDDSGVIVFWSVPSSTDIDSYTLSAGSYRSQVRLPKHLLNTARYFVTLAVVDPDESPMRRYFLIDRALSFQVLDVPSGTLSARGVLPRNFPGVIRPLLQWETHVEQEPNRNEAVT